MSLGGAAVALERLDCTHDQDQQQCEQQEGGSDVGQSTPLCKERRARLLLPAIAPEFHSALASWWCKMIAPSGLLLHR